MTIQPLAAVRRAGQPDGMGHIALAIRLGLRDLGRGIRLVFAFQGTQRLSQQSAVDFAQGAVGGVLEILDRQAVQLDFGQRFVQRRQQNAQQLARTSIGELPCRQGNA